MLTREQILGCNDRGVQPVHVPEWGGSVYIRPWSGADAREAREAYKARPEVEPVAIDVAMSVCDAEGNRIFTLADVDTLNSKCSGALFRIVKAVNRINGVAADDATLEKNSETTANSASG